MQTKLLQFAAVALFAALLSSLALAQAPLERKCMDGTLTFPYAMRGFNTPVASYSLKGADGTPRHVVLLGKAVKGQTHRDGDPVIHWRLIEKRGEGFTWCVVAFGDRVELLKNLSTNTPIRNKFGMPGSGFQRCSDRGDALNSVQVRLWANRELGDSFVAHLTSQAGEHDFTFLFSDDLNWILINTDRTEVGKSCYYSRGPTLSVIDDFKPRQALYDKLAEHEAREAGLQPVPAHPTPPKRGTERLSGDAFRHGVVRRAAGNPHAPFKIKTVSGANYFFKLVNASNGAEQLAGFIVGGTPLETKVPSGMYELRYAVGEVWTGETEYFGPDTAFAKTDTPLIFTVEANRVRGVEVELIHQRGGNLRTTVINKQTF